MGKASASKLSLHRYSQFCENRLFNGRLCISPVMVGITFAVSFKIVPSRSFMFKTVDGVSTSCGFLDPKVTSAILLFSPSVKFSFLPKLLLYMSFDFQNQ